MRTDLSVTRTLDTLAELTALEKANLVDGEKVLVLDGTTGGIFTWDEGSTATADGGTVLASDEGGDGRWLRGSGKIYRLTVNKTVNVPTDYETLQDALDWASSVVADQRVTLTVNIVSGHALTSGFRVESVDLSFVKITSDDAVVTCASGMNLVSNTDLSSDIPRSSLIGFLGVRTRMPAWHILVDMAGVSAQTGYQIDYQSDGVVAPGKGVLNTAWSGGIGGTNCRVTSGSRLQAPQSTWTGAKAGNVGVTLNAFANFQTADLSATDNEACLDVSRGSVVHAKDADLSDGVYAGLYVRRASASVEGIDLSNCGIGLWGAIGATVRASNSTFDGCSTDVICGGGSWISLGRSTKSAAALDPANSIVEKPGSGTAVLRNFNAVGGYGCISYTDNLAGSLELLTASTPSLTTTSASLQSVGATSYATALNLSGRRYLHGGAIYGSDVGVKITIDGVVVLNDGSRAIGEDSAGDDIAVIAIPPCKCESSIIVEAYNRASTTQNLGWKFYHSGSL